MFIHHRTKINIVLFLTSIFTQNWHACEITNFESPEKALALVMYSFKV